MPESTWSGVLTDFQFFLQLENKRLHSGMLLWKVSLEKVTCTVGKVFILRGDTYVGMSEGFAETIADQPMQTIKRRQQQQQTSEKSEKQNQGSIRIDIKKKKV